MNAKSEQLTCYGEVVIDDDQPLRGKALEEAVLTRLGSSCRREVIDGRKVLVYGKTVLLLRAVSYLGNPHPIFKKRIQLPDWYQDFCRVHQDRDVRFVGVYRYDDNVMFVDFNRETYLSRGLHNSSAHVYVNDLFQAQTYGVFDKVDCSGNTIICCRSDRFAEYLERGLPSDSDNIFSLFRQFNCGFPFGQWIYALDAIQKMYGDRWRDWRQAEWAGWFLENEFYKFTVSNETESVMRYVLKKAKGMDFDIRFEEADFYGDLKASDIRQKDAPGNDSKSLVECIYRYGRFWYVVYEHDTVYDKTKEFEATKARNAFIRSIDTTYKNDEMSYHRRMKHSVCFQRMTIIELNRVNFRDALKDFNQGHQADGKPRNPKFLIDKKTLMNDNYAVFRYTYS